MQAIQDIFGIWGRPSVLALEISANADTVRKWFKTGRIPEEAWQPVVDAANKRGRCLTIQEILTANRPMKPRGRPSNKSKLARNKRRVA